MASYKKDIDLMQKMLSMKPDSVVKQLEIVTPNDIGSEYMLHISTDTNIKKFTPYLPTSVGSTEDRTFPRICVSSSLLGCIMGIGALEHNFIDRFKWSSKEELKGYLGGYYIYGLKFNVGLRPTKKLVWDAEMTNELWLTSYSQDTAEYKPTVLGKFFIASMVYEGQGGNAPSMTMELFIETTTDVPVKFDEHNMCTKGYYRAHIVNPNKIKKLQNSKRHLGFSSGI